MTFEEYKVMVKQNVQRYLPEEYGQAQIEIKEVSGVSKATQTAIMISRGDEREGVPAIYLEGYYDEVKKGASPESTILWIAQKRVEAEEMFGQEQVRQLLEFEHVRDKIMICACNYEYNKDTLKDVPHMVLGEIAGYYRIIEDEFSVTITYPILQKYGLTREELHTLAVKNTTETKEFLSLNEMIGIPVLEDEATMYVLSTRSLNHGAGVMFCPQILEEVSKEIGGSYYIIPSSVHELLIVPQGEVEVRILNEIITKVNAAEVSPEERLAQRAFSYDPIQKRIGVPRSEDVRDNEKIGTKNGRKNDIKEDRGRTI